jgi:hypothetical protein
MSLFLVFKIRLLHCTAEKCSTGTTETCYIGANVKQNQTALLAPLKKMYCFTCAPEKNQRGSLESCDCSTGAAEKCSAGTSEIPVLALLKKKIKLLKKLCLKSDCSTALLKNALLASLKYTPLALMKRKLDCLTGSTEKIVLLHMCH